MKVGIVRETFPGEHRVALVPGVVGSLAKRGIEVLAEAGAGVAAGHGDAAYAAAGVVIVPERRKVFSESDVLLMVRSPGANPVGGDDDLSAMHAGQVVVGLADPLGAPDRAVAVAKRGVTLFALELLPRITRAQPMDVLSSMASLAGYKAILLAAVRSPRIFPMMMTAAGTLSPARVLVLGAGVAGLQAIATARRLGALVQAYDVRPEVREQVLSVGGKFVDLGLSVDQATDRSGYARAQSAEFLAAQRERLAEYIRAADVVVTTAAVPGRRAPLLITAAMQKGMKPGSVIVDLAAETGGNCELTRPGQEVELDGVTILGPVNLPASIPFHASQLYAKNISAFLLHLVSPEGVLQIRRDDEITRETLVALGGELVHPRVKDAQTSAQQAA
jgi:NAD(P) transhydrogenase subunit alpha